MTGREEALLIGEAVARALAEDCAEAGDITSKAIFSETATSGALIRSKERGVLSGAYLLKPLYHAVDPSVTVTPLLDDGAALSPGSRICTLQGATRSILAGERTMLNFLQHLSGIATATAGLVELIAHTRAKLLDTRKTAPLLRYFEKRAVRHGGGFNHRFGLFDMILIKDTHVKAAGGVARALARATAAAVARPVKIEVEVQTKEEFAEAVPLCPDRIMLDNMSLADMAACVAALHGHAQRPELEASGNITAATIAAVAETGVDFISSGAITHSAGALDIHLIIER